MRYYCSICKETISGKVYDYSMDNYDKALCREHQKKPNDTKRANVTKEVTYKKPLFTKKRRGKKSTPEAELLYQALIKKGAPAYKEKWDGHKHIDIAIPEAKINIEVDGMQHNYSHKQALSDLKRTFHSFKKGYVTFRIPNALVKECLGETADLITGLLNISNEQLNQEVDDDY